MEVNNNKEVLYMLKLTVKPGEYIQIGEEIKVIFSGGSANNMHVLIDAPRKYNLVRSKVIDKQNRKTYYREKGLSEESISEIRRIIKQDKEKQKKAE